MGMCGQRHAPAVFPPGKGHGNVWILGWMGPRAGLDGCEKSRPNRDSIPGMSSPYLVDIPTELSQPTGILCSIGLNPLKPELNPICYLLALLGAHHFLHVSRIRVKLLTFRLLMSYIYMEHPFLMFLDHTQRRSTVGRTPLDV